MVELGAGQAMDGAGDRTRCARIRRGQGRQARPRSPAAAGGPDRPHHPSPESSMSSPCWARLKAWRALPTRPKQADDQPVIPLLPAPWAAQHHFFVRSAHGRFRHLAVHTWMGYARVTWTSAARPGWARRGRVAQPHWPAVVGPHGPSDRTSRGLDHGQQKPAQTPKLVN